jgi:hypothetical protein
MTETSAANNTPLCLPVRKWPPEWREKWYTTFEDELGPHSHHKPSYIYAMSHAVGALLRFLVNSNRICAVEDISRDIDCCKAFVAFLLKRGNSPASILSLTSKLEAGLRKLTDVRIGELSNFVTRLSNRVKYEKRNSTEQTKKELVYQSLEEILRLGLDLYDEALTLIHGKKGGELILAMREARMLARDGLIIILFCHCPLRKGDMARIDLEEHVKRLQTHWELQIRAEKNDKMLVFPFPDELTWYIRNFIEVFRPEFPLSDTHTRLWPGAKDAARVQLTTERFRLTKSGISKIFAGRTGAAFEHALYPHFVRSACVEFWERHFPNEVEKVFRVLGHNSFDITELFYAIRFSSDQRHRLAQPLLLSRYASKFNPRA